VRRPGLDGYETTNPARASQRQLASDDVVGSRAMRGYFALSGLSGLRLARRPTQGGACGFASRLPWAAADSRLFCQDSERLALDSRRPALYSPVRRFPSGRRSNIQAEFCFARRASCSNISTRVILVAAVSPAPVPKLPAEYRSPKMDLVCNAASSKRITARLDG